MCKINFKKVEAPRPLPQEFKVQEQQIAQFPSNFEETDFTQSFLKTPDKNFTVNPFQFTFEPESEITFVKNAFPLDLDINLGSYVPKPIEEIINLEPQLEIPSPSMPSLPIEDTYYENLEEFEEEEEEEEDDEDMERSISPSPNAYGQLSPVSYDSSPPHSFIQQPQQPNNLQFVPSNVTPLPKKMAPECAISNNKRKAMPKAEPPSFEVDTKPNVPPPKRKAQVRNSKISDEKRERNRLAAEKYRKKGRDTIVTLERACHQLNAENAQLKDKSQMLEQQVQQLKTLLLQYGVSKELLDAVGLSL